MAKSQYSPEVSEFHPLVAKWLEEHEYTYQHHYRMPEHGIADFRAEKDGKIYIVECKIGDNQSHAALRQIRDYTQQIRGSKGIILVSENCASERVKLICEKHKVEYIVLPYTHQKAENVDWWADWVVEVCVSVGRYGFYIDPEQWAIYYGNLPVQQVDLLKAMGDVLIDHERRIAQLERELARRGH